MEGRCSEDDAEVQSVRRSDSGETEAAAAVMDPYIIKAAWLIRWYSFPSSAYVELSREDHKC